MNIMNRRGFLSTAAIGAVIGTTIALDTKADQGVGLESPRGVFLIKNLKSNGDRSRRVRMQVNADNEQLVCVYCKENDRWKRVGMNNGYGKDNHGDDWRDVSGACQETLILTFHKDAPHDGNLRWLNSYSKCLHHGKEGELLAIDSDRRTIRLHAEDSYPNDTDFNDLIVEIEYWHREVAVIEIPEMSLPDPFTDAPEFL